MTRHHSIFFCSCLLIFVVTGGHAATTEEKSSALSPLRDSALSQTRYRSSEIIVKYKSQTNKSEINQFHRSLGNQTEKRFSHIGDMELVENINGMAVQELLAHYRNNPNVEYAEPNFVYTLQIQPNDANYPQMWSLNNIGQTGGTVDADINAPEAWDIHTGDASVVIASIDTGVDYNHPDLVDNIWVNPGEIPSNNLDDDNNGYVDDIHGINTIVDSGDPIDDNGHGTHTIGTMAARGNNSIGVTGINWNTTVISCKFLDEFGSGSLADAIECLDYLLALKTRAQNPVNIVVSNNSWGGGGFSQALRDAIEAHQNADILFVAAAGNAASDTDVRASYPAAYDLPGIISVAATDDNDQLAFFSNFGRTTVDVGAPGASILSTFPLGNCDLCQDNSGYGTISGTSMAAPHVAGLAALLKAQDPSRNSFAIKNLIMSAGQITPATDGVVLSSRRIRAADINGVGSLTCNNQALSEFIVPANIVTTAGTIVPISALQINCDQTVSDPVTVTILPSNQVINLLDDGTGPDQVAGDGLVTGEFIANETGSLELPNSQSIPINIVENYGHPTLADANYRTLNSNTEQSLDLNLDTFAAITSPFPIAFGGSDNAFTTLYALSHGVIAFEQPNIQFINASIPTIDNNTWIAPYWDDVWPNRANDGDNVFWDVQGSAPNRELIIEYRNLSHFSNGPDARITFQVVFFENSSDVLFNYADTDFSNNRFDNGASATIGIQVTNNIGREYSFNSAGSILEGQALLWELNQFADIDLGSNLVVSRSANVNLDATGINVSPLNTIVSYQWSQVAGPAVTLNNADTAVANFIAPDASAFMIFDLLVTDSDGAMGQGRIQVRTNSGPQASALSFGAVNFGELALLIGFTSSDPDNNLASFEWVQTAGTPVMITGANSDLAVFTAPNTPQILSFQLTVVDSLGLSDTDTVDVRVNNPPTVSAGNPQTVTTGTVVSLQGNVTDTDGSVSQFSWSQLSGPTATLASTDTATTSFTPTMAGSYQFQLTVADDDGATASATTSVTVNNKTKKSGGAFTAWYLTLLGGSLWWRRRRPQHRVIA